MIVDVCQRWKAGSARYRPAGEPFEPKAYEVEAIPGDTEARAFITEHHYSGSYPAARFRYGLYERWGGRLVGVAVFSVPARAEVTKNWICGDALSHVELGRLVLLDEVGANAESWFVAAAFRMLRREGIAGVVSFSDPVPRVVGGTQSHPGHVGTVYQALGGIFTGRSTRRTLRLLKAGPLRGRVFSDRALSKVRAVDQGYEYAAAQLVSAGADPPPWLRVSASGGRTIHGPVSAARPSPSEAKNWVARWLPEVCQKMAHPGNFRYVWALETGALRARTRQQARPYPKLDLFGRA